MEQLASWRLGQKFKRLSSTGLDFRRRKHEIRVHDKKGKIPITLPALFMQEVKKEVTTKELQQELRKILKGEFRCIKMKTVGLWMITLAPDQIVSDMHLRQAEAALSDTLATKERWLRVNYSSAPSYMTQRTPPKG